MSAHDHGSASPHGGADPRSAAVRTELERIERRWRDLPLDRAHAGMPRLRHTLDGLTAALGQPPVADLGPATALHQLQALVWDAARAAGTGGHTAAESGSRGGGIPDLARLLTDLRRDLP